MRTHEFHDYCLQRLSWRTSTAQLIKVCCLHPSEKQHVVFQQLKDETVSKYSNDTMRKPVQSSTYQARKMLGLIWGRYSRFLVKGLNGKAQMLSHLWTSRARLMTFLSQCISHYCLIITVLCPCQLRGSCLQPSESPDGQATS